MTAPWDSYASAKKLLMIVLLCLLSVGTILNNSKVRGKHCHEDISMKVPQEKDVPHAQLVKLCQC